MNNDLPDQGRKGPEGSVPDDYWPDKTHHEDEELSKKALGVIRPHYEEAANDNDVYAENIWQVQDWMSKCGLDASKYFRGKDSDSSTSSPTKNTDETEADTGSTLVYTLIRVLSTQIASVFFSDDYPFKYAPANSGFHGFDSLDEGEELAAQYNRLARKTMDMDDFTTKCVEFLYQMIKYSNVPLHIHWDYCTQVRRQRVPIKQTTASGPNGELETLTTGYEFIEGEYVVRNHPSLKVIPPENFYANRLIANMNDQHCITVKSLVSYSKLWEGQRAGYYHGIENLSTKDMYQGDDRTASHDDRARNIGISSFDDADTGQFMIYDVWVRLPIGDDDKWNAKENEWRWYWVTIAGSIDQGEVIRFQRNPDPDDEPPFLMLHAQPDDGDELYHFGPTQALESNFREETTAKNQMIDSKTIQLRRPLIGVRGEVYSEDLTYEQNKVIWTENGKNSLSPMEVPNAVFEAQTVLQMLQDDSKRAVGALDPVMGEAMGSRTSALEADNAFNQALQPSMVGIRYVSHQFFPWYARKIYRMWQLYSLPEQVLELTHEDQKYEIKPSNMWGEFDVNVTVVDEYVANQAAQRNLDYIIQNASQNPQIAGVIKWDKLWLEMFRRYKITKNPAEFIKKPRSLEAEQLANQENDTIASTLTPIEPREGEDHETHMNEHKAFRERIRGLDQSPEYAGVADIIDQHIALTKMLMDQEAQAAQASQQQPQQGLPPEGGGLPSELGQAALGAQQF